MTWGLWLYFHLKEGVLWIFIAIKNPLSQLGLNLHPLGPVASTLTTTSLRRGLYLKMLGMLATIQFKFFCHPFCCPGM
jgi:hypothetical protein